MEAQSKVEEMQAVSHIHASGEVFEATNLEAARGMCPVLGRMSLEEAGLLLELESMGKEQITDQTNTAQEKPVVEKVEKTRPKHDEIKKVTATSNEDIVNEAVPEFDMRPGKIAEPAVESIKDGEVSKPIESDVPDIPMFKVEAGYTEGNDTRIFGKPSDSRMKGADSSKNVQPTESYEEVRRPINMEIVEVDKLADDKQKAEILSPVIKESPPEKSVDVHVVTDPKPVLLESLIEDTEPVSTEEAMVEPVLNESVDDVAIASATELAEAEDIDENEYGTDSLEQINFEYPDVLTDVMQTEWISEAKPIDFIKTESLPETAITELPAPLEYIESKMTQLVETIEKDEVEVSEKIKSKLKEIVALPAKLEAATNEEVEELKEKLEVLFVELFEESDISYTPELIKSFVRLAEEHYLDELLKIIGDEETQGLPDETGTREFLQKLQQGLRTMNQSAINFYKIGKSIMRLYSYNPETATVKLG